MEKSLSEDVGGIKYAIIGGYDLMKLKDGGRLSVNTPYGQTSNITIGRLDEWKIAVLDRHGRTHEWPPHRVNYRANIWALKELGVEKIVCYAAVGSLRKRLKPGNLIILDDFIDLSVTHYTFFEGGYTGKVRHVDLTEPFCPAIRKALILASEKAEEHIEPRATYICTEGPRFETPSEIRAFQVLGGDIVGMTIPKEAVLAKEALICYGTIALITNYACGITPDVVSYKEIVQLMRKKGSLVEGILKEAISILDKGVACKCQEIVKTHAHLETWPEVLDGGK